MDYHLICVHPFGKYTAGQMITDPDEVGTLLDDREHNFVRIAIPAAEQVPEPEVKPEPKDPAVTKALSDGQALIGKMAMDKQALDQPWPAPQPGDAARKETDQKLAAERTTR